MAFLLFYSSLFPELEVVNQAIGGAVILGSSLVVIQLRQDLLGNLLAVLHTPLIEGIDIPDHTLHKDFVLVDGD